jgi:two-component system nitrogen regulation response regulator GlnG
MPFDLQTRLLRVLSDGHFYRVGGHSAVKANVRVIAATHQNLEQRVKEGGFREDLFHRLNVIRLRLPALRERREDVPMLTRYFLQQSARQLGVEPKRIADGALQLLCGFDFPGNVRQLENVCHWLTVMAPAQVIDVKDLPPEVLSGAGVSTAAAPAALPWQPPVAPMGTSAITDHEVSPDVPVPPPVDDLSAWAAAETGSAVGGVAHGHAPTGQGSASAWDAGLEAEARNLLESGRTDVWDTLTQRFETTLIQTALAYTRGRRIEAAQKLGIGRNTITRKIQELNLE